MRAIIMTALLLLTATAAQATDKPVPFRVCLSQQQAMQVYKGKKVKYRLIKDDQGRMEACWYAGLTAPKTEFIPRATGVAAKPARPITQDTARAQVAPFGSIPNAGYSEEDHDSGLAGALDALCGGPCVQMQTFESRWHVK